MRKKAYVTTLGCKVNQFESAAISSQFQEQQLLLTDNIDEADIIVINTCAVTAKASAQSRQEIRKAARRNSSAEIVVTGCHAQLVGRELLELPDISADRFQIVGNDSKERLVTQILKGPDDNRLPQEQTDLPSPDSHRLKKFNHRTRAFLKVQDGCDSFCSYCIVPYVRGRSRSLPRKQILLQASSYAEAGHKEIVITGIHVGNYGHDLDQKADIASLMDELTGSLPRLRFRLSSIEPLEISDQLLTLMRERDNFMPHLHIPLQSGDDQILARMNRRYTSEQFLRITEQCRAILPDAALGLDVLVGFPGEEELHHRNTIQLIEQIDCTYLHVFPYSKRPGTPAATFEAQVDKQVKRNRVEHLRLIGERKRTDFYSRFLDSVRPVLFEEERDGSGNLKGFTDNYIPVKVKADDRYLNSVTSVRLMTQSAGAVIGRIEDDR